MINLSVNYSFLLEMLRMLSRKMKATRAKCSFGIVIYRYDSMICDEITFDVSRYEYKSDIAFSCSRASYISVAQSILFIYSCSEEFAAQKDFGDIFNFFFFGGRVLFCVFSCIFS